MSLDWKGDQVAKNVIRATKRGIDMTMTEAVLEAKQTHPWDTVTGNLERSVRIHQKAIEIGDMIVGIWGSTAAIYAKFLEFGTRKMKPYPFLIPAAAEKYPNLSENIKTAYSKLI